MAIVQYKKSEGAAQPIERDGRRAGPWSQRRGRGAARGHARREEGGRGRPLSEGAPAPRPIAAQGRRRRPAQGRAPAAGLAAAGPAGAAIGRWRSKAGLARGGDWLRGRSASPGPGRREGGKGGGRARGDAAAADTRGTRAGGARGPGRHRRQRHRDGGGGDGSSSLAAPAAAPSLAPAAPPQSPPSARPCPPRRMAAAGAAAAPALYACTKCNQRYPFEELSQGQQLCKVRRRRRWRGGPGRGCWRGGGRGRSAGRGPAGQ